MDYSRLSVLLWRCVQDLNIRVKQLEGVIKNKKQKYVFYYGNTICVISLNKEPCEVK